MPVPRYKPLVDALASEIRTGRLPAGARLPTHGQLAATEGIATVTATRVYAELEAIGLVSREQGRGTFVRDLSLPASHGIDQQDVAADAVDLNFNSPALPDQGSLLRQALREIAGSGDIEALLRYQPHRGRLKDRAAIARHLVVRGIDTTPEHVLVVNGAQHGLAVTLMATLNPGDIVAVDALTYSGFKALAHALHLDLAPVPVTSTGTDLDALDRLCSTRPVRAIYAMPSLHNPLGAVLGAEARERLVGVARRSGALLVEDASYAYLVEDAPAPLVDLAPDITVYVSSLSKNIATGLRVGYLVAPATLVPALERAIRRTTWNTTTLAVEIACRWIDDGTVDRLELLKREDARARQVLVRRALADLPHLGHDASYFTWLPLPEDARADRIAADLAQHDISVSTAGPFAVTSHVPQAIRLALGSADLALLPAALRTVAAVVEQDRCT